MDELSRTLQDDEKSKLQGKNVENPIDFRSTWRFNASEDDEKRKAKKIWCKQQALLLASKVDRKTINELLLKEQDVFQDTPKYLAVTKRLYRPFADQMNLNRLDESTNDDTESVVDCSTEFGGQ